MTTLARMSLRERIGYYSSNASYVEGLRITAASYVGPIFWPAWYLAPAWKRDQWHKIGCELPVDECDICRRHYGLIEQDYQ